MTRLSSVRRLCGMTAMTALLLSWYPASAAAQPSIATQTQESIEVPVGSVFEIMAVEPQAGSSVSWVLSKADGTFVQADRGRLFHERFAEQGAFTLRAEMTLPDQQTNLLHTLLITTLPPAMPAPALPDGTLVQTDPPLSGGRTVTLGTTRRTIRLLPPSAATPALSLDMDAHTDTNGDGDPANDADGADTFFQNNGTPLILWFPVSPVERTLIVSGTGPQGPVSQTIVVSTFPASTPDPAAQATTPTGTAGLPLISVEDRGNGAFAFRLKEEALSSSGRALLFLWNFGDSRQSMLDRPVHTYAANGDYTVSLTVRDLKTTTQALQTSGALQVTSVPGPGTGSASSGSSSAVSSTSSASSQDASSSAGSEPAPPENDSSVLGIIVTILGVVVGSLVIGILLMLILSRLVRKKLDETEGPQPKKGKPQTVQKKKDATALDQPPPMSVLDIAAQGRSGTPAADFPAVTRAEESPADTQSTPPDLTIEEEQAPAWLLQGVERAKSTGQTPSTPPPATLQPPAPEPELPPPAPQEPPAPAPVPSAVPAEDDASIPPWLKEKRVAPSPPIPAPEPEPELPTPPPPPPPESPASAPLTPPEATVQEEPVTTQTAAPTAPQPGSEDISPEERERRRKKRQRYRANKHKRELVQKAQESVPAPAGTESTAPQEDEREESASAT
ncbi:MAG: PKD domain-containing protein, partial [Candidatus Peribacteraceae bacterium]|nr:PKD domain-containing protein [Candidatus Peribacteraceae bacterium]